MQEYNKIMLQEMMNLQDINMLNRVKDTFRIEPTKEEHEMCLLIAGFIEHKDRMILQAKSIVEREQLEREISNDYYVEGDYDYIECGEYRIYIDCYFWKDDDDYFEIDRINVVIEDN